MIRSAPVGLEPAQPRQPVARLRHREALVSQRRGQHRPQALVVVNEQHPSNHVDKRNIDVDSGAMEPLFLRACRGETTERAPLWLMRQAGRYLPEYRQVRAGVSFLELCKTPKLAAEVTLQPIRRFGFDAAILFSDLLVPLEAMGLEVEFTDQGPRLPAPLRTPGRSGARQPLRSRPRAPASCWRRSSWRARELGDTPLIGFAGAPFTVATYAIEGKTAKTFSETKKFFYREPEAARRLLALIAEATRDYLLAQIRAGAQAVQLFDSWVGVLSAEDFETFALPPTARAGRGAARHRRPGHLLRQRRGLDPGPRRARRRRRSTASTGACRSTRRARTSATRAAVQGNLDPSTLLGPIAEIERRARDIVRRGGKRGHVFNLGHGIYPETPIEAVEALVAAVRGA